MLIESICFIYPQLKLERKMTWTMMGRKKERLASHVHKLFS
jgi:hypothetical protein